MNSVHSSGVNPARRSAGAHRRAAATLVALVLGLGGPVVLAPPAAAVDGEARVDLPTTGSEPTIVAASGESMIIAVGDEGDERYELVTGAGAQQEELAGVPFFRSGKVRYVGGGVMYYADEFQGDDTGDFSNVYAYRFATRSTDDPVRIDADSLTAVGPTAAIFADADGYTAQAYADRSTHALQLPDHATTGTPTRSFELSGDSSALRVTRVRSNDKLGQGYLDRIPLDGTAGDSVAVAGLAAAALRGGQVVYLTGTTSRAQLCFRGIAASSRSSCVTVKKGDYSKATAELSLGSNWVLVSLHKTPSAALVQYVATGTTRPGTLKLVARTSSMQSLRLVGRGDSTWPLGLMLTGAGGFVAKYDPARKKISTLFGYPQVTASVRDLQLTAASVTGLDDRPARGVTGSQAWRRPVGDTIGQDQTLSPRARQVSVSAGRTLIAGTTGTLVLQDAGKTVRKLPATAGLGALSGPYYLTTDGGRTSARRVDGAWLAGGKDIVALFGPVLVRQSGRDVTLRNLEDGTSNTVTAPAGVTITGLWGTWLLGEDADGSTVVLSSDGAHVYTHDGAPQAIGDGFAVIAVDDADTGNTRLGVWNFRTDQTASFSDPWRAASTDGVHRLAYTTDSELVVVNLDDLSTASSDVSSPLELGALAPKLFYNRPTSAKWAFQLDASKALSATGGVLRITGGASTFDLPAVDPDGDGSIRVTWNGRDSHGAVVPAGTYTWKLVGVRAYDGSGPVRTVAGGEVEGQVTVVSRAPSAVTGATPTVDDRNPKLFATLTVDPGAWKSVQGQPAFAYQWYRGSRAIAGATGRSYDVTRDDLGAKLRVKVTGSADGQKSTSRYSARTAPVVKLSFAPTSVPTISPSPDPVVAQTLHASTPDWDPEPDSVSFQWYRVAGGKTVAISGARAEDYAVQPADAGARLLVKVTASRADYQSATSASAATGTVVRADFSATAAPTIDGEAVKGSVLTARPGSYDPAASFGYHWFRTCGASPAVAIDKATKVTYTLASADVGCVVLVRVTATRSGYNPDVRDSDPTPVVTG